jgi:hypothetical protein
MPGQRLPIRSMQALLEAQPYVVFLFAWNFVDGTRDQQREYLARGGKFIFLFQLRTSYEGHEQGNGNDRL